MTTIYVTHDQIEAMTMGDRVAVLRKGVLQQEGPRRRSTTRPTNLFVATFIGLAGDEPRSREDRGLGRCSHVHPRRAEDRSDVEFVATHPSLASYRDRDVAVGIKPEHLTADERDGRARLRVEIRLTEPLGAERLLHVAIAAPPVLTEDVLEIAQDIDATTAAGLAAGSAERETTLIARVDPGYTVAAGSVVELGVDPGRLTFFDLESGAAIR